MLVRRFHESAKTARDIDFSHILNQIKNPIKYEHKDELPLLFGYTCKNNIALKENLISVEYLILDYEKSKTIDWFKEWFRQYQFYLYTSFSHKIKDDSDRFRVIVPLDKSYDIKFYEEFSKKIKSKKQSILSMYFDGVDSTCFNFIGQKVPGDNGHYYYHINEGEKFSFGEIPELLKSKFRREFAIDELNSQSKKTKVYKKTSGFTKEQAEEYFENKLDKTLIRLQSENTFNWRKTGTGQGTDIWLFKAASALIKCKLSKEQVISYLLSFTNGKRKREIEHKVNEAIRRQD